MIDSPGSNRKILEIKYRIAWYIGTVFCFFLYFSGIVHLYVHLRKRYLKRYVAVVLMYHRVSDDGKWPDITVSTTNFKTQMRYLKNNFNMVSIDEMMEAFYKNRTFSKDGVVITFDDGFKDNFTCAYPILKEFEIPAAVFVAADYIEDAYALSSEEMTEMLKGNIIFGAHTMTHRVLSEIDNDEAYKEILLSKSTLEEILHENIEYFAYPYGKTGRDVTQEHIDMVKEIGFKAAFVTDNGFITENSDPFAMHRIGVRNVPLFVLKVRLSGIFENRLLYLLRRLAGI